MLSGNVRIVADNGGFGDMEEHIDKVGKVESVFSKEQDNPRYKVKVGKQCLVLWADELEQE